MSDNDTLLAYLVPTITSQVEVAATKSLAYILNKSKASRTVVDELIGTDNFRVESIERLTAEETLSKGSRLDLVGYDASDKRRLLVEAKFWAPLDPGQITGYFKLLKEDGPGVLLFLVPDRRARHVWAQALSEMEAVGRRVKPLMDDDSHKTAEVEGTYKRIALITWNLLLNRMEEQTSEQATVADIRQLMGLTRDQEGSGFEPLTKDAAANDFAARDVHFRKMISDVVSIGERQGWITTVGLTWGVAEPYCRRYLHLVGTNARWLGLGVEYRERFYAETPFWIWTHKADWQERPAPPRTIDSRTGRYCYTPVELPSDAEYQDVVQSIVNQLRNVQDALPPNDTSKSEST
ncbi:MAG: hypothetical protein F4Z51_08010 [Chloroflexi bacterium]|nr:hypothetical protein [Chloroflexota bacterium]MYD16436.1 hypothetical protein [Chloroflexota bacterium]MYJ02662.1 hypothetical protein [Chloroflexota bacterium]